MLVFACAFCIQAPAAEEQPKSNNQDPKTEPFRPLAGEFPPLEKSYAYRGELTFVDHANRRGSIRVQSDGKFRFIPPNPFAMLPYGIVRYHGAPADLRDVPLGTMMHARAFLPPDPKLSAVPVLPINNRTKKEGNAGVGSAPAENHVLLLEDEPSHCLRTGKVWKLAEVEIKNKQGMIVARRESREAGDTQAEEETMTFDAATRIWRGREFLGVEEMITDGEWPASGKKIWKTKPSCSGSPGSPPRAVFSPASTYRISGWMMPRSSVLLATRTKRTKHSSAPAGYPPSSTPSSMANSAPPP